MIKKAVSKITLWLPRIPWSWKSDVQRFSHTAHPGGDMFFYVYILVPKPLDVAGVRSRHFKQNTVGRIEFGLLSFQCRPLVYVMFYYDISFIYF
jgi:hypothetical protein